MPLRGDVLGQDLRDRQGAESPTEPPKSTPMDLLCPLGGSLVLALGEEGSGMVCWQHLGWWGWGTALPLCLQEYQGTLERDGQSTLPVTGRAGDALDVLLENMGRLSFGANFSDFKVRGNSQTPHRPHPGTLSPG